jgi:hypothetical protein
LTVERLSPEELADDLYTSVKAGPTRGDDRAQVYNTFLPIAG